MVAILNSDRNKVFMSSTDVWLIQKCVPDLLYDASRFNEMSNPRRPANQASRPWTPGDANSLDEIAHSFCLCIIQI